MRREIKTAKERINKIRRLMSGVRSRYTGMSKREIIDAIRKTRERLWEAKLAAHSR